jgi:hypothetical protein
MAPRPDRECPRERRVTALRRPGCCKRRCHPGPPPPFQGWLPAAGRFPAAPSRRCWQGHDPRQHSGAALDPLPGSLSRSPPDRSGCVHRPNYTTVTTRVMSCRVLAAVWHVSGTDSAACTFPLVNVAPAIGLEPITCRLTEGLSWPGSGRSVKLSSPLHLHQCLSGPCSSIFAAVPTRAGECRFVRVVPVLIFSSESDVVGPPHDHRLDRVERLLVVCGHAPHRHAGPQRRLPNDTRMTDPAVLAAHHHLLEAQVRILLGAPVSAGQRSFWQVGPAPSGVPGLRPSLVRPGCGASQRPI